MAKDNAPRVRAERMRRDDEIALPQGEHLRADEPAGAKPRRQTDGNDEGREREAVPQRDGHEEDEDPGQGEADVDAAHQDGIDPALVVARDRPHQRSERNGHQRPKGADAERHASAVHHPAPEITAQVVRPQQKCPRRWVIREMNDVELLLRIEGRDERRRQRDDDQKRQDPET